MDDPGTPRTTTPSQLAWLRTEVRGWQAEGLVDAATAERIVSRYRAVDRMSLARLLLLLGSAFVGVGLIWLVAANLDQFPPLARFVIVTVLWLLVVAAAHVGAERRLRRGLTSGSPLVGAARGLAALAYGAVVFQAAQSLQVPAYEPALLGYWAAGAMLYAYAVRGVAPLLISQVLALSWLVWQVALEAQSGLDFVVPLLLAACFASAVAVGHDRFVMADFAAPWRESGALLLLGVLFAAAIPEVDADEYEVGVALVVSAVLVGLVVAAAVATGRGTVRLEPVGAVAASVVAVVLVLWERGASGDTVTASDWAQSAFSVVAYVAVAAGVATLGVLRDSARLTFLALAALVLFTTVQSFAVFARVIEGAWLFVVLGLVFAASGYVFDRGRRRLEATLEGAPS